MSHQPRHNKLIIINNQISCESCTTLKFYANILKMIELFHIKARGGRKYHVFVLLRSVKLSRKVVHSNLVYSTGFFNYEVKHFTKFINSD